MLHFLTSHAQVFYEDDLPAHAKCVELVGSSSQILKQDAPRVWVCISQISNVLNLSFFIEKHNIEKNNHHFDFPDFSIRNTEVTDFLWQDTCLECFFSNGKENYIEINASPNGAYAIYQFDGYRTPNQLPPQHAKGYQFYWQRDDLNLPNFYHRHINLLSHQELGARILIVTMEAINPCVILYQTINGEKQPIYYAVNHANPPDFHDKTHLISF